MAGNFSTAVMAELTTLGENPVNFSISIVSLELDRLTISGAPHLAPGALVKVRQEDNMWLGEVVESSASGTAAIQVVHSLKHLGELFRLADHFMGKLPEDDTALTSSPTLAPAPTLS